MTGPHAGKRTIATRRAWTVSALIVLIASSAPAADDVSITLFGGAGDDAASAVAIAPDGDVVIAGTLGEGLDPPAGLSVHRLMQAGDGEVGRRAFVAKLAPDLDSMRWLALFPAEALEPTRIAVADDGTIVLGGKRLARLATLSGDADAWGGREAAIASLAPDGATLNWIRPGGPNQQAVSGLAVDSQGRVYWTAGTTGRGNAAYLLRYAADGGPAPWTARGERSWCVDLHTSAEDLRRPGQYWHDYFLPFEEDNQEGGDGYHDYDGEGGWEGVRFNLHGIRVGGQVIVLPDGDVVVSGGMQYDFRVKGKKKFPAFDLFLARYSAEGELRWSTNLYQPGDSVHTPDQKPIDLAYDAAGDAVIVLAKQHGSNVYRFKGDLVGDTGNLMISWVGRVDAATGDLKAGWYFMNNRHGRFDDRGKPLSPPYPKLAGNALQRVRVDAAGRVYVAGNGGAVTWTSPDAWRDWPADQAGGSHGMLYVLAPDLSKVLYGTVIRGERGEAMSVADMGLVDGTVWLVGSSASPDVATRPTPAWAADPPPAGRNAAVVRLAPPIAPAPGE